MYTAVGVLIIIIAILLILIVIIQNPKGGMMSSTIGTVGNQILGASKSTDTVEKFTWYLASALMILSIASIFILPDAQEVSKIEGKSEGSAIQDVLDKNKSANPTLPSTPVLPPQHSQGGTSATSIESPKNPASNQNEN